MKTIKSVKELEVGDVVLVVGYDHYNFASGDADGWFSEIFSVSETTAVAPDGQEYPDRKLVKPEGEPLDLARSNQRGWIPLYDAEDGKISFGYDGGAHACSIEVGVVLLQRGRMRDNPYPEDDTNPISLAAHEARTRQLIDSQMTSWEERAKHADVAAQIQGILDGIPDDTGLTSDEVKLEVAAKIVETFPRGVHGDVDVDLDEALTRIQEAGVYYGGTVHPEDK